MEFRQSGADGGAAGHLKGESLLTAAEADRLVEGIRRYGMEDIGTPNWLQQHSLIEKLNLQAHHNAMAHSDEFVMEALILHDKLAVLVHELLAIELWKEQVYPLCSSRLAEKFSSRKEDEASSSISLNLYLTHYHEAALANLLEVCLFHRHACQGVGDDELLELTDYCHRKLLYLNTEAASDAEFIQRSASELLALPAQDELEDKLKSVRFGTAMCALTILRYLTDYVGDLPISVMARMMSTHDSIMQLVPLLDAQPWTRRRERQGKPMVEKFQDGAWHEVARDERLRVAKPEAQVWLALHNLVVDPRCRARYTFDDFRKSVVGKLRRHFHELLFDQLPVLKDLQRTVEELAFANTVPSAEIKAARLVLEQVPEVRQGLLAHGTRDGGWQKLADHAVSAVFVERAEDREAMRARVQDMLAMFDFEGMMEPPKCAACGAPAVQRCSRCKNEWYCGRKCQVGVWKRHKPVCDLVSAH
eukprot:jgi/Mesvir1/14042/Mv03116-RA.1